MWTISVLNKQHEKRVCALAKSEKYLCVFVL